MMNGQIEIIKEIRKSLEASANEDNMFYTVDVRCSQWSA